MAPTATTAAPPGTPTPVPPTPTPEPTPDFSAFPAQVVTLLNERRAEQGLAPLRTDGALQSAAMSHAAYMGRTGFVGHYPPNGTTPAGRIAAAGFQGTYQGEVLSGGQPRARQALAALLASPAHAAILLSSRPTAVGVGHSYAPGSVYTHYWVIVTGSP